MQKRNFCAGNNLKTSIRLEKPFFSKLDEIAQKNGCTWHELVTALLADRPQNVSRASHIRCSLI